jgi:16S rRNA (adenine1518-N6/adenine1519-N6)-dimethyltransferase
VRAAAAGRLLSAAGPAAAPAADAADAPADAAGGLAALPPLREVIARHGLSARKALGQNFLLDGNVLDKIARIPGPLSGATAYEVGPGPGAAQVHVVANLPYNIATPLLVRWLSAGPWPPWWASLSLMLQKEVAQRVTATPGAPAYGRLAVLAQWRSHPRIAMTLPARAFTPAPKVDSAVVHITPAAAPAGVSPPALERVTAAAFGQRRKMLRQALKALPGGPEALAATGIDPERRAETLSVAEFMALARAWAAGA